MDFYYDNEEAETEILAYIKFLCENICLNRIVIVSPDTHVVLTYAGDGRGYVPVHLQAWKGCMRQSLVFM